MVCLLPLPLPRRRRGHTHARESVEGGIASERAGVVVRAAAGAKKRDSLWTALGDEAFIGDQPQAARAGA